MEGLKPGTRVSTMDPEGPMTRVTDILVHPGRVQRAHRLAALGKGPALRGPSHSHLSRLEQPERCPSRVTAAKPWVRAQATGELSGLGTSITLQAQRLSPRCRERSAGGRQSLSPAPHPSHTLPTEEPALNQPC